MRELGDGGILRTMRLGSFALRLSLAASVALCGGLGPVLAAAPVKDGPGAHACCPGGAPKDRRAPVPDLGTADCCLRAPLTAAPAVAPARSGVGWTLPTAAPIPVSLEVSGFAAPESPPGPSTAPPASSRGRAPPAA